MVQLSSGWWTESDRSRCRAALTMPTESGGKQIRLPSSPSAGTPSLTRTTIDHFQIPKQKRFAAWHSWYWVYLLIRIKRSTARKFGARSKILNKCQVALHFCRRKMHIFERAKRAKLWINKWEIGSCSVAPNKQIGPLPCHSRILKISLVHNLRYVY